MPPKGSAARRKTDITARPSGFAQSYGAVPTRTTRNDLAAGRGTAPGRGHYSNAGVVGTIEKFKANFNKSTQGRLQRLQSSGYGNMARGLARDVAGTSAAHAVHRPTAKVLAPAPGTRNKATQKISSRQTGSKGSAAKFSLPLLNRSRSDTVSQKPAKHSVSSIRRSKSTEPALNAKKQQISASYARGSARNVGNSGHRRIAGMRQGAVSQASAIVSDFQKMISSSLNWSKGSLNESREQLVDGHDVFSDDALESASVLSLGDARSTWALDGASAVGSVSVSPQRSHNVSGAFQTSHSQSFEADEGAYMDLKKDISQSHHNSLSPLSREPSAWEREQAKQDRLVRDVKDLIGFLKSSKEVAKIQAAIELARLCADGPENRMIVARAGAIRPLLNVLTHVAAEHHAGPGGLAVLQEDGESDAEDCERVTESTTYDDLAHHTCQALSSLCQEDVCALAVLRGGGILLLLQIVAFDLILSRQSAVLCIQTICDKAGKNSDVRNAVGGSSSLNLAVKVVETTSTGPHICAIISLLGILCEFGTSVQSICSSRTISACIAHMANGDAQLRSSCSLFFGIVAGTGPLGRDACNKKGCIQALVAASLRSAEPKTRATSLHSLCNLVGNDSSRIIAAQHGVFVAISEAMFKGPTLSCQSAAAKLLVYLLQSHVLLRAVLACNLTKGLIALAARGRDSATKVSAAAAACAMIMHLDPATAKPVQLSSMWDGISVSPIGDMRELLQDKPWEPAKSRESCVEAAVAAGAFKVAATMLEGASKDLQSCGCRLTQALCTSTKGQEKALSSDIFPRLEAALGNSDLPLRILIARAAAPLISSPYLQDLQVTSWLMSARRMLKSSGEVAKEAGLKLVLSLSTRRVDDVFRCFAEDSVFQMSVWQCAASSLPSLRLDCYRLALNLSSAIRMPKPKNNSSALRSWKAAVSDARDMLGKLSDVPHAINSVVDDGSDAGTESESGQCALTLLSRLVKDEAAQAIVVDAGGAKLLAAAVGSRTQLSSEACLGLADIVHIKSARADMGEVPSLFFGLLHLIENGSSEVLFAAASVCQMLVHHSSKRLQSLARFEWLQVFGTVLSECNVPLEKVPNPLTPLMKRKGDGEASDDEDDSVDDVQLKGLGSILGSIGILVSKGKARQFSVLEDDLLALIVDFTHSSVPLIQINACALLWKLASHPQAPLAFSVFQTKEWLEWVTRHGCKRAIANAKGALAQLSETIASSKTSKPLQDDTNESHTVDKGSSSRMDQSRPPPLNVNPIQSPQGIELEGSSRAQNAGSIASFGGSELLYSSKAALASIEQNTPMHLRPDVSVATYGSRATVDSDAELWSEDEDGI